VVSEQLAALEPMLRAALIALAVLVGVLLAASLRRIVRRRPERADEAAAERAVRVARAGDAVPRVLEARGVASADDVRDMNEREQLFLFEQSTTALGPRGAMRAGRATPAVAAAAQTPRHPPATLRCPLCTALLGGGGAAAYFVGACPGCGRRLSARIDGARLVITVDEVAD
jgi:hypothetical protein